MVFKYGTRCSKYVCSLFLNPTIENILLKYIHLFIGYSTVFSFFSCFSFKKNTQSGFEFGDTMMAGNVAGRKIQNAIAALQDLERYEAIDTSLQIKQFLAETCDLLTQMVRELFSFLSKILFFFVFFCSISSNIYYSQSYIYIFLFLCFFFFLVFFSSL